MHNTQPITARRFDGTCYTIPDIYTLIEDMGVRLFVFRFGAHHDRIHFNILLKYDFVRSEFRFPDARSEFHYRCEYTLEDGLGNPIVPWTLLNERQRETYGSWFGWERFYWPRPRRKHHQCIRRLRDVYAVEPSEGEPPVRCPDKRELLDSYPEPGLCEYNPRRNWKHYRKTQWRP